MGKVDCGSISYLPVFIVAPIAAGQQNGFQLSLATMDGRRLFFSRATLIRERPDHTLLKEEKPVWVQRNESQLQVVSQTQHSLVIVVEWTAGGIFLPPQKKGP